MASTEIVPVEINLSMAEEEAEWLKQVMLRIIQDRCDNVENPYEEDCSQARNFYLALVGKDHNE